MSVDERAAECAAASIQLYSRLWLELETLGGMLSEWARQRSPWTLAMRLERLLLELVVLLDACDSTRWHSLLPTEQRSNLQRTLAEALHILSVPVDALSLALIGRTQNLLFDSVKQQAAALGAPRSRPSSLAPYCHQGPGIPANFWLPSGMGVQDCALAQ
jgi:hypothetical protein